MNHVDVENRLGTLSKGRLLSHVFEFCKHPRISMAAWRAPGDTSVHLILDFDQNIRCEDITLEKLPEGFMFSPFHQDRDSVYIKKEVYINLISGEFHGNSEKIDSIQNFSSRSDHDPIDDTTASREPNVTVSKAHDHFLDLVALSLDQIRQGRLQKVVPSRSKEITLPESFTPGEFFFDLCDTYANAFISLVYHPECGAWIGATPELLIDVRNNIFKTVALAGTQRYSEEISLSEVAWTQKEIEEQALVSRYIINCFKKIRLREFDEIGPKTVKAGNLIHLKTEYTVDMAATNFPDLGSVMLKLLHPTSAICGMPLEASLDFIRQHEDYDREYFSGYLGPVNFEDKTSLFVNLRCMKMNDRTASLYAGAGVTEDSNPEKEWLETEMKMNTLLNIIR